MGRHHGMSVVAAILLEGGLIVVHLGGCVASRSPQPGELDTVYRIEPDNWDQAVPKPLRTDRSTWPYRYELAFEPSPVWSTIKLHETFEALPDNDGVAVFPVSQRHADAMAALFARFGGYVERLSGVLEESSDQDGRWAELTADLLIEIDALGASMSPDIERRRRVPVDWNDTAAWVLVPLLQSLSAFFTEELPPDVAVEQPDAVLVGGLLRSSFRLGGREVPPGTTISVLRLLHDSSHRDRRAALIELLEAARSATVQRYPALKRSAEKAAKAVQGLARALEFLAEMTDQWSRFNSVALEWRILDGRTVVGLDYDIRPGERVVFDDLHFAAPRGELVGRGRVIFLYEHDDHREITVQFSSVDNGGLILRFDGVIYALADLLAFKLDDAYLREVRYRSTRDSENRKQRTYEIMMHAPGGAEPRRVIRIETTKAAILTPRPDLPPRLDGRRRTTRFEYHNGKRVYERISSKTEKPKLWGHVEP